MSIAIVSKPANGKGHIKAIRQDLLTYLDHASHHGDFLKIPVPLGNLFLLNHPDLVQEVLVKQSSRFHKPFGIKYTANQIFGDNLFTSDGELWRVLKGLIQPGFDVLRLQKYGQTMIQKTEQMIDLWETGQTLDLTDEMMVLTLRTTTQCFFGVDLNQTDQGKDLLEFIELFFKRITSIPVPGWVPIPTNVRLKFLAEKRREFCRVLMTERRQSEMERDDILSMLIKAQEFDTTGVLNDEQIANEVSNLFAAGFEVTAYSLAFTLYLLHQHPEVESLLRQEIERELGDRTLTYEDLERLPYLEQVIKEAMRLYPVTAVVGRQAIENVEIQGDRIPKRSTVLIAPWILHRRADIFETPLEFKPDRFKAGHAIPKFAYLPFSGGPRGCIGQGFAMMQMRINLAMIMQKFRLKIAPDYQFKPIFKFNTRPLNGLPMQLEKI